MSFSVSSSHPAQIPDPLDLNAHWITPEEQLMRLHLLFATQISNIVPMIILDVAKIIAQYEIDDSLTNWYTALKCLKVPLTKIPPLRLDIRQFLNRQCPIYGSSYKIKDTHFFILVPKEYGDIDKFEREMLRPYGQQEYGESRDNPFQLRHFWDKARTQHGRTPFPDTCWGLMTKEKLPGSIYKTWEDKVALIEAINKKAFTDYETPTLQQILVTITTDMVATQKHAGKLKRHYSRISTQVQETTMKFHLVFSYTSLGLRIDNYVSCDPDGTGITAFRKV